MGRRCVSGVKCQHPFLTRPTLSTNGSCGGPLHMPWIEENTILSSNSALQRNPDISFDQAEVRATSLASSADMVSHLSSITLESSCYLGLWAEREIIREVSFSIQLHEWDWFSRLGTTLLLWGLFGEGEAGGQLGSEHDASYSAALKENHPFGTSF